MNSINQKKWEYDMAVIPHFVYGLTFYFHTNTPAGVRSFVPTRMLAFAGISRVTFEEE